MNRITTWAARLPIGNLIEWTLPITLFVIFLALMSGCATQPTVPAVHPPLTDTEAKASALKDIGVSATDGETKRMALFAVAMLGNHNETPQPVQAPRSGADAFFAFLDRTSERLFGIAPALFAYRGQVRQSQTTETVAAINRDVSLNQSNNFLALGQAGINGTASLGTASVNALATVASRPATPTTQVTVTGNQGPVNVGPGTQTNNSNNPINPNPTVCTTAGTPPVTTCAR